MRSKSIRINLLIIFTTFFLLVGCAVPPQMTAQPSNTPPPTSTATTTEIPTPTSTPSPTPTPLPLNGQQTQYFIEATVDYYNRFVTASSRSVYTNKTSQPINEMMFIIYPTIFQDAIYIKSVKKGSTSVNYNWESHRMVIPLGEPLLPGEQTEFTHDFELYIPNREGTFGHTGRQLNLSYWFPFVPPRTDDAWLINEISLVNSQIVGEHITFESADFDVSLSFTDRRENMKIAAGAIPQETAEALHYKLELARTFTLSISDIFIVTARDVNGIQILSYAFPEDSTAGEAAADIAVDAIKFFTQYYGPIDKDLITLVEADFLHGMEFDGLVFLSRGVYMFYDFTPKTNLTIITPHEISHQWFFSQVGNNQAMEPWLDEAIATYSEALFYEEYYPDLVPWWWENRINNQLPQGYIDNTIYLEGGYPEYLKSVYLNGARFYQEIRETIGDQAFQSFIQAYLAKYRYQIVTGADFWETLREYTDADLSSIQEEYFASPPTIP
jgi:hypothetical protein